MTYPPMAKQQQPACAAGKQPAQQAALPPGPQDRLADMVEDALMHFASQTVAVALQRGGAQVRHRRAWARLDAQAAGFPKMRDSCAQHQESRQAAPMACSTKQHRLARYSARQPRSKTLQRCRMQGIISFDRPPSR